MDWRDYPCLITPKTLCPTNHLRIRSRDSGGGRTSLVTLSGEVEKIVLFASLEKVSPSPISAFPEKTCLLLTDVPVIQISYWKPGLLY